MMTNDKETKAKMGIVSTTQTKAQDSVFVLLPALPSLDSSSLSKRFQSKKDISVGGEGHLRFSTSTKRKEIFNYSWLSFFRFCWKKCQH